MKQGTRLNIPGSAPPGIFPTWALVGVWMPNVASVFLRCDGWRQVAQVFAAISLAFVLGQRIGSRK